MQEIVAWHDDRALMDYVTCGTGSYFDFYKLMPTSLYPARLGEPFAAALKQVTSHALVQAESHIRTPAAAEDVLAAGHADMVSIVRGQIADPHLVRKAREGRADDVRPCISCNQLCWGRRSRDYWISCLINPSAGREHIWGGDRFVPAERRQDRARRRCRTGRPRGRARLCRARPRGHRRRGRHRRSVVGTGWPDCSRPASRCSTTSTGTAGSSLSSASTCGSTRPSMARGSRRAGARDRDRRDGCFARSGRVPTGGTDDRSTPRHRRAATWPRSTTCSTTCATLGSRSAGVCSCSTTSATGRGSEPRCSCRSAAATCASRHRRPTVAAGLFHSAADVPARQRFARAGGVMRPHTVVDAWHGDSATLRSTLTGAVTSEPFDWLVIAETPRANDELGLELGSSRCRLPSGRRLRRPAARQPRLLRRPIPRDAPLTVPVATPSGLCHRHRRRSPVAVTQTGG